MRRDHHHRHGGMNATQGDQSRKTARARHGQVEQHQVDVLMLLHQRLGALEVAGLINRTDIADAGERFLKGAAKQRMVVGDDKAVACRQCFPPPSRHHDPETLRGIMRGWQCFSSSKTRPGYLTGAAQVFWGAGSSLLMSLTMSMKLRRKRSM